MNASLSDLQPVLAKQGSRFYRSRPFESMLPWLVLLLLLGLTFANFFLFPYAGFDFTYDEVVFVYSATPPGDHLEIGDRLSQAGSLEWEDYLDDPWQPAFPGYAPGDVLPLTINRDGRIIDVAWIFPGPTTAQIVDRFMELWWLGYVFWLAGTSTLLFLRPRHAVWKLLVAFNYLAAVWLIAGSGPSRWHILGGAIILRSAVWLFVVVSLHLNWLFPRPLARLPAWFWGVLYALAGILVLLEWLNRLPPGSFQIGLIVAGAGIILLQLAHLVFQPAYRKYITPLVAGVVIAIVPPLLVVLRDRLNVPPSPTAPGVSGSLGPALFIYTASMLGIAALPGIYFYSVYMLQAGRPNRRVRRMVRIFLAFIIISALSVFTFAFLFLELEAILSSAWISILLFCLAVLISGIGLFPLLALPALQSTPAFDSAWEHPHLRANRLVSLYLFFALLLVVLVPLVFILLSRFNFPVNAAWISLAATLTTVLLTILGYGRFQQFVDRQVLGIPLPPTHLLESYSSRITTSLEPASLVSLLRDELLPSLLVRQSALYQVSDNRLLLLYAAGLSGADLSPGADLPGLLQTAETMEIGGPVPPDTCQCPWVRELLPLRVERRLVGVWLLGRRDPDDSYDLGEVGVLRSIANQTAIALVNIQQSERLHALYQADIERQEAERAGLALFLHDEVLNPLAALSMQVEPGFATPKFEQGYQALVTNLREAVRGLRPAMLNYGLYSALAELVDELIERDREDVEIRLEIEPTVVRYAAKVEQHLYRIVEQACENALRHARCRAIVVRGRLGETAVELQVQDDGIGLPAGVALNLSQLLIEGHYGLVGMYERAALVGADLKISSTPEAGTCIGLVWIPDSSPAK